MFGRQYLNEPARLNLNITVYIKFKVYDTAANRLVSLFFINK